MNEINFGTPQVLEIKTEAARPRSLKDPDLNIPITHNGKQGILLRTFGELAICKMAGDDTISYFFQREVEPWLEREKIKW